MTKKWVRSQEIANTGSSFESFLEEEGILAEVDEVAAKRVLAWKMAQKIAARKLSEQDLARQVKKNRHRSRTRDEAN